MLLLDMVAPSTPFFGIPWNMKEMKMQHTASLFS